MLSTLIELQRLKNLGRTGWTLRGLPAGTESVAAHSFGVTVTAMMLSDELTARGTVVDMERLLRMALLHDWSEARIGDLPKTATDYFGGDARKRAELVAFDDIVGGLDAGKRLYRQLYEDYEQRATLEARLVKAADVIGISAISPTLRSATVTASDSGLSRRPPHVVQSRSCMNSISSMRIESDSVSS